MAVRPPVSIADVDRALVAKGGLYRFVRLAWPIVEPAPYVDSRHIELVCAHLEAVSRGECKRLVINIPPGCSKSLLVSVFWPAWDWATHNPGRKWMNASFDLGLSLRDAERLRDLICSNWYRERWGDLAPVSELKRLRLHQTCMKKIAGGRTNSGAKSLLRTAGGGLRFSTMVRGKATGWHADFQVMDDPTKPADIQAGGDQARLALDKTRTTWASTFASRKANPKTFARVIVMQRLHEHDLSATAEAEGYTVLRLPMEYDPKRHCKTPWGEDWRTVAGELLAPGRFDRDTVETTKRELGPRAAAAQLQQDPTSDTGAVFDRAWFTRRWTEIPAGCRWWQSWDCTFKASGGSDYVVGQVWAQKGVDYYLVDQVRARMTFTVTLQAIRDMTAKHKRARLCLVEDKANGTAVMDTLRGEIPGLVAVEPLGGKVARAQATTGLWQAGQVLLPAGAEWTGEFVEEHASFPLGAHDDQVDAASQALTHGSGKARVSGKLNKIKSALTGGGPVIQGVMRVRGDLRAIEDALSKIRAVGEIKCKAADTPEGWHVITMTGDLGLAKWAIQKQELGQVQG